jgi:uncharacterized protein YggE
MTSRPLLAVALVVTLVTAGCLGSVQAQQEAGNATDTDADGPAISVTATADVEAEPDLAVVRVAVEATADSAAAAREQVATDTDAVRTALENASLSGEAVTTAGSTVQPQYDRSGDTPELVGYRATHALRIEVADVDRAGEIVDLAVENGATSVNGVQFTLAEDTRAELRSAALTDAMDAARTDAETIASAAGLTVTGVQQAETSRDRTTPGPVLEAAESDRTTFSPGPVTVSATVSVTYGATAE